MASVTLMIYNCQGWYLPRWCKPRACILERVQGQGDPSWDKYWMCLSTIFELCLLACLLACLQQKWNEHAGKARWNKVDKNCRLNALSWMFVHWRRLVLASLLKIEFLKMPKDEISVSSLQACLHKTQLAPNWLLKIMPLLQYRKADVKAGIPSPNGRRSWNATSQQKWLAKFFYTTYKKRWLIFDNVKNHNNK